MASGEFWDDLACFSVSPSLLGRFKKNVGSYVGGGAEGKVYEYGLDNVIKIGNNHYEYEEVSGLVRRLKRLKDERVVRVREVGRLRGKEGEYDSYYMIMEKLSKLNDEDHYYLRDMVRSWDRGIEFEIGDELTKQTKEAKDLWAALEKLKSKGLYYIDLHDENVLRDGSGMKLVDIEGFLC